MREKYITNLLGIDKIVFLKIQNALSALNDIYISSRHGGIIYSNDTFNEVCLSNNYEDLLKNYIVYVNNLICAGTSVELYEIASETYFQAVLEKCKELNIQIFESNLVFRIIKKSLMLLKIGEYREYINLFCEFGGENTKFNDYYLYFEELCTWMEKNYPKQ